MEIHNIRHLHAYPRWIYLGIHVNPQWNPRAESMPFHMESLYFHGGSRWKCVGTTCFRVEMAWIHVEGVEMANSRWIFLDPSWNDAESTIWATLFQRVCVTFGTPCTRNHVCQRTDTTVGPRKRIGAPLHMRYIYLCALARLFFSWADCIIQQLE